MGSLTATDFAWSCLGMGDYPPPEPEVKRGRAARARYGPDAACWLCDGETDGVGWWRDTAIPSTFTNHNQARCLTSESLCQPCAAMASKATWERYVAAHPEKGLKTGHAMSWRCYSHVFSPSIPGGHDSPNRARWRQWLLDPPDPPFLFVVAESGQKHLIFRARIAYSRDRFPVQVEEDRIFVDRQRLALCLDAFEWLYQMGFTKDEVRLGEYSQARVLAAGLGRWRAAENAFVSWRQMEPDLVRLAHFVAELPAEERERRAARAAEHAKTSTAPEPAPAPPPPTPEPEPAPSGRQGVLF